MLNCILLLVLRFNVKSINNPFLVISLAQDHQERAHSGTHKCPFCENRFDTKTVFLDHLITHSEFNVSEWEHFFAENDEEDVNNNNMGEMMENKNTVSAASQSKDLTSATSSPPPLISVPPLNMDSLKPYPCK